MDELAAQIKHLQEALASITEELTTAKETLQQLEQQQLGQQMQPGHQHDQREQEKALLQIGRDSIPNVFDGKDRNSFTEWAENVGLYLSCFDDNGLGILTDWAALERETITEDICRAKCQETGCIF